MNRETLGNQVGLNGIVIRQVRQEDLAALEWEGEYTHFRRLYAEAFRRAEKGESVLWVAEIASSRLIGQLFVHLDNLHPELIDGGPRAYIYGFRLRTFYRGKGIGSHMLRVAEDDLIQRGYRRAVLNVGQDNPRAKRLYERHGYHITGADPGNWSYIDDQGRLRDVHEPAWRMEKALRKP